MTEKPDGFFTTRVTVEFTVTTQFGDKDAVRMITGLAECPAVRRKVLRKVETNFNVLQPHATPTNVFEDVTNAYPEAVPGQLQMALRLLSEAQEELRTVQNRDGAGPYDPTLKGRIDSLLRIGGVKVSAQPVMDEAFTRVILQIIANQCGKMREDILLTDKLFTGGLYLDSLDFNEVVMSIETEVCERFPEANSIFEDTYSMSDFVTVGDILNAVQKAISG